MVRCITRVAILGSLRLTQVVAKRETKKQNEVKEIHGVFYCELCNKQYKLSTEFQTHLSFLNILQIQEFWELVLHEFSLLKNFFAIDRSVSKRCVNFRGVKLRKNERRGSRLVKRKRCPGYTKAGPIHIIYRKWPAVGVQWHMKDTGCVDANCRTP